MFVSLLYLIFMIIKNRADIEYASEGKSKQKERSAIVERGFRGWLYAGGL